MTHDIMQKWKAKREEPSHVKSRNVIMNHYYPYASHQTLLMKANHARRLPSALHPMTCPSTVPASKADSGQETKAQDSWELGHKKHGKDKSKMT